MRPTRILPAATLDLDDAAEYLVAESGSLRLGERFHEAAASTMELLSTQPELGRHRSSAAFHSIRWLTLHQAFSQYVILYEVRPEEMAIIRVLHGAQDIASMLGVESDIA